MNQSKKPTLQESMKRLGEMTLLDRFLFSEAMSDPEVYTAILQIILGQESLVVAQPRNAGFQPVKRCLCDHDHAV